MNAPRALDVCLSPLGGVARATVAAASARVVPAPASASGLRDVTLMVAPLWLCVVAGAWLALRARVPARRSPALAGAAVRAHPLRRGAAPRSARASPRTA